MSYSSFYSKFPEIAECETRVITLLPGFNHKLPPGQYALCEMFCDEAGCDCRRVFFYVTGKDIKDVKAVIAYGWENREFYEKWMGEKDKIIIDGLMGPVLNMGSPQSKYAHDILDMVKEILLTDKKYVDRVKKHYAMFRAKIDGTAV